jgi:hypothetical protein
LAYAAIEPFGPQQQELRAGTIAATLANVHREAKAKAYVPADFFPSLDPQHGKPVLLDNPEAQSALVLSIFQGVKTNE